MPPNIGCACSYFTSTLKETPFFTVIPPSIKIVILLADILNECGVVETDIQELIK